ncbi:hypothetical protein POY48_17370, partial [Phocaeicola vulgatus]|nr:hypothetical protein [Phocaeicola vulgatus]MDC1662453.1 hypothetical protein [Phocaeicola vulgatus]
PLHLDYTKVIILILWWRNFQLEYWRTFQLVSTIENLSDEDISLFLHKKWIDPIVYGIDETLAEVLSTFEDKVCALGKKYAVSYKHLNEDVEKSQKELSGLINELTGDEFAILGLNELINDEKK